MSIFREIFSALSESGLGRAEEERITRLSVLPTMFLEIGEAMTEGRGSASEPLALLTEAATLTLQANRCLLFLYDHKARTCSVAASSGAVAEPELESLTLKADEGPLAELLVRGATVFIKNKEDSAAPPELLEVVDVESFVLSAFSAAGRPLGFLYVDGRKGKKRFDDADMEMIELLSKFAAVAVEFSRMVQRQREYARRLTGILEISRALNSTHEPGALYDLILAQAVRLTGATSGELSIVDYKDKALVVKSTCGFSDDSLLGYRLSIDKGICGQVVRKGKPVVEGEVKQNTNYIELKKRVNSELAAPIFDSGRVIAVINLEHGRPEFFSDRDRELVEILAENAAVAIRNAALIDDLRVCGALRSTGLDDNRRNPEETEE